MLLDCGANVTVISPVLHPDLTELANRKSIQVIRRSYKLGDLKGALIVVAATDVKKVNRKVAMEAGRVGALVNVVDDPEPSDFIVPSFFRRGDLTVAVATAGRSPALARRIRTKLEQSLGDEYGPLIALINDARSSLKRQRITVRAEDWQAALDLDLLTHLVRAGHKEKAKAVLVEKLKRRVGETEA
jgi:siroheme synthase-like protein